MKGIIVDDDQIQRTLLRKLCDKSAMFTELVEFESAIDLMKYLKDQTADVILLDIHMPNFSGIDFIKSISHRPQVIFITGDKDFALEAFEYDAIDYLLKPVELPRFLKAVNKANERIEQEKNLGPDNEFIFIKVDSRLIKLNFDDILFIEAKGDYISVVTAIKKYIVHNTLKHILTELPSHMFQQSHRSFIANITRIKDIQDSTMLIEEFVVPIGRSIRKDFLTKLGLK